MVAEQAVEREHDVGVAGGVGHDLMGNDGWIKQRLVSLSAALLTALFAEPLAGTQRTP